MTLTISFYCFLISTVDDDYSESLLIQTPEYYSLFAVHNSIGHFTVVGLVTWPLNGSEAGVDLVSIKTSLFLLCKSSCSYAN